MIISSKIVLFPILIASVTLFGLAAADISRKNPSPAVMIGASLEQPAAFFYDGPPLLN